jgi:hypothetical protein
MMVNALTDSYANKTTRWKKFLVALDLKHQAQTIALIHRTGLTAQCLCRREVGTTTGFTQKGLKLLSWPETMSYELKSLLKEVTKQAQTLII